MKPIWKCQLAGRSQDSQQKHANLLILTGSFILVLIVCPAVLSNAQQPLYQEAYSEDPYLISYIAGAIVKAVQGNDLSAPSGINIAQRWQVRFNPQGALGGMVNGNTPNNDHQNRNAISIDLFILGGTVKL